MLVSQAVKVVDSDMEIVSHVVDLIRKFLDYKILTIVKSALSWNVCNIMK